MQVKKFEAPTMQEALKVIKRELGPEAIILSTKQIKSGFGLMSKASVEVTAAISEKDIKKKNLAEKGLPQEVKEKIWNSKSEKQIEIYDSYFEKQLKRASKDRVEISAAKNRQNTTKEEKSFDSGANAKKNVRQETNNQKTQKTPISNTSNERRYIDISDEETVPTPRASGALPVEKMKSMEREIEQLRSMVNDITSNPASSASSYARDDSDADLSDELVRAMHDLVMNGIEKKFARQIVQKSAFDLNNAEKQDSQAIEDRVAYHLVNEIEVKDILEGVGAKAGLSKTTIISLVGPTGVGKTTTIAKIASLGILEKRLRVGLINLDSYKVAAADQLATYARIMNIPFRSVNSKEDLQQAIYDFSSLDLVLIDTTGRSQKDQESLLQLRHILATISECKNILMVSATTKDSDMNEVVSRFRIFHPVGLVFSKLDETSIYGCIYNVQKKSELPLLYFTVGQRVPEDIEKASAERVVDLILDY